MGTQDLGTEDTAPPTPLSFQTAGFRPGVLERLSQTHPTLTLAPPHHPFPPLPSYAVFTPGPRSQEFSDHDPPQAAISFTPCGP